MNTLYRTRWFPLSAQIVSFFVFVFFIYIGLQANTADMSFAKTLRNVNIGNLLVWSYWWPLIIIVSVFFGRLWCTVCPMELVTSIAARFGLKKRAPKLFKSGWVITMLYVVILLVGIHTWAYPSCAFSYGMVSPCSAWPRPAYRFAF